MREECDDYMLLGLMFVAIGVYLIINALKEGK